MFTWSNRCVLHEAAVAARVRRGDAEELVEIEGRDREKSAPARVQRAELAIERERRPSGRQAEHECAGCTSTAAAMRRASARATARSSGKIMTRGPAHRRTRPCLVIDGHQSSL